MRLATPPVEPPVQESVGPSVDRSVPVSLSVEPVASVPGFLARGLGILVGLSKAKITVAVTFSVATGYVVFAERLEWDMLIPMIGVFFMACGSAAINQVQEWRTDCRMPRTSRRPIPAGLIAPRWALFVAFVFLGLGLNILTHVGHHRTEVLWLGAFSVLWYNGIYWALKRLTAFAVVPGALIGALPPMIGWCAAGGTVFDPLILQVALFFFIWQIPHFWLLLHLYGTQYEEAGLPSPTGLFTMRQFQRMVFAWIIPTAACGIVTAVSFRVGLPWNLLVLIGSIWIVLLSLGYLRMTPDAVSGRWLFNRLNLYALSMMLFLMLNALL